MRRLLLIQILAAILVFNTPELFPVIRQETQRYVNPFVVDTVNVMYDSMLRNNWADAQEKIIINGTDNSFDIIRSPSITAWQIDQILASYGSPAIGTGKYFIEAGIRTGVDPAYVLAIFLYESTAGTNPNWVGYINADQTTHNIGNIRCAGYLLCYKGFRQYNSWKEGIDASFDNLAAYPEIYNITTIDEAINIWAPPSENNTSKYVEFVRNIVGKWRRLGLPEVQSTPLDMSGNMGYNVRVALNANQGALKSVVIRPNETWSFNETVGNPVNLPQMYHIAGVYGGGWCDLAGRYVFVARSLGLQTTFEQHGGIALNGLSVQDSPYIWNISGTKGNANGAQDVLITNNTDRTIYINAVENDNQLIIIGRSA